MRTPIIAALVAVATSVSIVAPSSVHAAPAGDDEVIAFEVRGVGNGHGRGLSQWGAYGRAIAGQSWQDIVGAYYGATLPGTRSEPHMRVRLTGWDGAGTVGVMSAGGTARWNTDITDYSSLYARETTTAGLFDVYGNVGSRGCPGALDLPVPKVELRRGDTNASVVDLQRFLTYFGFSPGPADGVFGQMTETALKGFQTVEGLLADGVWNADDWTRADARIAAEPGEVNWQLLGQNVLGPIRFSTPVDQNSAGSAEVLGICKPSGAITHYRGAVELIDTSGGNRVVNDLDVENYMRGVLPREVSASWGDAVSGRGMNALRAQAVAARSYGLAQNRYPPYASTCDTSSCQVYGGAASRITAATNNSLPLEHPNTDRAVVDTAGSIRTANGATVSTEFSASNGPRTAGGAFPAVDDPFDDQPGNPNHRWTRIIDADLIRNRYALGSANGVVTARAANSPYDGIWVNEVRLGDGRAISAWDFRNAFGLPAPGFELIPITRKLTNAADFAFIGDSVGVGVSSGVTSDFQVVTEYVFGATRYDSVENRRTQGGTIVDGVGAAWLVPEDTDLVLVELGYNDDPATMGRRIDAVMEALRVRRVGRVVWVNLSERRTSTAFRLANAALAAATQRWSELVVIDWNQASSAKVADRWFADGVHLTTTGNAEFASWLRSNLVAILADGYVPPSPPRTVVPGKPLRVPVLGRGGVPASGVVGVALNVTSVGPKGPGFLRVWPCGSAEPGTSSVNWVAAGAVEPNAVVVPVDATGEVCVSSLVETDVIVDVSGWFESGLRAATGRVVDTRETGVRVRSGDVMRVPVTGRFGVPAAGAVGVALNVTSVGPKGPGFLRVWPCGSAEPGTSSVNWVAAGAVEPNAVVVPVDATGEVCVSSLVETDVIVDLTAWFDSGLRASPGARLVDTRVGVGPIPPR